MAEKSFDNTKPLAKVTIKKRKVSYEYDEYFLFKLLKPTMTGLTHAIISDQGQCIGLGTVVEGVFEVGSLVTTGEIDSIIWNS